MMPGMDKEADVASEEQKQRDKEEEEEEEEEKPTLPTPRKRLMNFKIPLVKGSQRRDQQQSVVARRRLFGEEQGMWVLGGEEGRGGRGKSEVRGCWEGRSEGRTRYIGWIHEGGNDFQYIEASPPPAWKVGLIYPVKSVWLPMTEAISSGGGRVLRRTLICLLTFLEEAAPPTKSRSVRYYSDISSSEDFSSSESDEEEEVSEEESEPPEPNRYRTPAFEEPLAACLP